MIDQRVVFKQSTCFCHHVTSPFSDNPTTKNPPSPQLTSSTSIYPLFSCILTPLSLIQAKRPPHTLDSIQLADSRSVNTNKMADMTPFQLPQTNDPLRFLAAVALQPFPFAHLLKDIRLRILAFHVAPTGSIGVKLNPWLHDVDRPDDFRDAPFSDALIALRSTCRLLYSDTGEALFTFNTLLSESLESLAYLTRTLTPLSLRQIQAISVNEEAFFYADSPTNAEEQLDHTQCLVEVFDTMPSLKRLTITIPWPIRGQFFATFVRFFVENIPQLQELAIRRPLVEYLLPEHALRNGPAGILVMPGWEINYVSDIAERHPDGFRFPSDVLLILAEDALLIAGVNVEVGDRLKLHQTEYTEELARWLGSGEGWQSEQEQEQE